MSALLWTAPGKSQHVDQMTDDSGDKESSKALAIRLGSELDKAGRHKPVMHMILPDGSEHPFRDRCLLIEGDNGDKPPSNIRTLLIDEDGNLFCNEDGAVVICDVPPTQLEYVPDQDQMMTRQSVAELAGVEKKTIYRAMRDGELTKHYVGGRYPRYQRVAKCPRADSDQTASYPAAMK